MTCSTLCLDGEVNGGETDVGCGGGACQGCAIGRTCNVDTDCLANNCAGNMCKSIAPPLAVILGSTVLGYCNDLELNRFPSTGKGFLYHWGCTNDEDLNEMLRAQQGAPMSVSTDHLHRLGFTYEVTLYVVDVLERQSPVVAF